MEWPPPEPLDTGTRKFYRYYVYHYSTEVFIEACLWDKRGDPGSRTWDLTVSAYRRPPDETRRDDIPLLTMREYTPLPENIMALAYKEEGPLCVVVVGVLQKYGFGYQEYENLQSWKRKPQP